MSKSTQEKKQINTTRLLLCTQPELMPKPTWLAASDHERMLGPRAWAPGLTVVATLQREAPHLKTRRAGTILPNNFGEGAVRPLEGAGLDREAAGGACDRTSSLTQ